LPFVSLADFDIQFVRYRRAIPEFVSPADSGSCSLIVT
jgi:hypothetical protein